MGMLSITFDDALPEHIDLAVPLLEARGMRGTFFIPAAAPGFLDRWDQWRAVAARGHELGNHTLFHPAWFPKPYVTDGNDITRYTLDRIRLELAAANRILSALDGRSERTFAYPCSNPTLGRAGIVKRLLTVCGLDRTRIMGWVNRWPRLDVGSSQRDYSVLLPDLFLAARCGKEPAEAAHLWPPDRYKVPCLSGDGMDAPQLIEATERALAQRPWTVWTFHGIGGSGRLACAEDALRRWLDFLAGLRSHEVLPFGEAARRIWGDSREAPGGGLT